MMKLSDEQIIGVVYSSESVLPNTFIDGVKVLHERLEHQQMAGIIESIGGKVTGEHVSHAFGEMIDENQFEEKGGEQYV